MLSISQGDHGFLGKMVHEKMSFGSFPLANLVSEACPRHIAQTSDALHV